MDIDSSCINISALVSMTKEIFAVTWDAQPALGIFVVRIFLGIVTRVPEEFAAVIASPRSVVAQRVHDGAAQN